ncbi:MAG TPA: glycosyltransferase [Phycisphaerales bacterium]|nr:glycosyltransferase [Phycisphaerales bacterium]
MVDQAATARRVCIAYPFFPHYRGPVLAELLARGKHRYTLVGDRVSSEPSIKVWEVATGTDWVDAPVWAVGKSRGVYMQPGLIRAGLSGRYDVLVIHSGVWWPTTWLCAIAGRLTGKRVLSWGHGWTRPEGGWRGWLRRVYYRLYHAHMTYGHYAKIIFMQTGWEAEGVQVIYNSLDYARQRAARESVAPTELAALRQKVMGGWAELPLVACVTRLIPVRRLDLLIEAAALLKAQGRPVALLLVGDGPERAPLEALAKERGVACVFYGACYDEEAISRLVMLSRCVVAPGKVGLTAMTALAYGVPVVTHGDENNQMPEWEAVVPGKTGTLFKDGDVADLARAVGVWTLGAPDPAVAGSCIEIIERFWNAPMQRRCIERCIDGKPADDLFWMKEPDLPGRTT